MLTLSIQQGHGHGKRSIGNRKARRSYHKSLRREINDIAMNKPLRVICLSVFNFLMNSPGAASLFFQWQIKIKLSELLLGYLFIYFFFCSVLGSASFCSLYIQRLCCGRHELVIAGIGLKFEDDVGTILLRGGFNCLMSLISHVMQT